MEGETRSQAAERRVLAVSSIQALALDYDVGDHDILKESVLLEVRLQHARLTLAPLRNRPHSVVSSLSGLRKRCLIIPFTTAKFIAHQFQVVYAQTVGCGSKGVTVYCVQYITHP